MTNQALDILDGWRPNEVAPPPADLVARYEGLIRFLDGLPPDARAGRILRMAQTEHEVETVRCVRCLSSVSTDKFCHGCNRFLWGQGKVETLRWGDVPSVEGLLNPASAYPVPPEHTLSPTRLAIWLATCDEMARLEMEAA